MSSLSTERPGNVVQPSRRTERLYQISDWNLLRVSRAKTRKDMASRVDSQVVRPLGGGTKIPVAIRAVAVPPMVSNANRRDRLKRQNVAALSAPEPLTLNGPAPEDGLVGANTARSTSLATTRSQVSKAKLMVFISNRFTIRS